MDDDFFDWPSEDNDEPLAFEGSKTHETAKAVLWHRKGDKEPTWIPRSHIVSMTKECITITPWIADQKGWIEADNDDDPEGEIPF